MKKKISILGSTGSIGLSTLKIIDKKKIFFKVVLLSANKNYLQICKQIKKYKPIYFVISDLNIFIKVKKKFINSNTKIINNFELKKLEKNQIIVSAIPGIAGLKPTISMIKFSKKMLIANKESVICGWDLIKRKALRFKTKIIPVDSEHFSIFNLLKTNNINQIQKIYLTASGGPFLNYKINQLNKVTPKDALRHPKWKMGKKITIDSSTLMNKILELVEAQKLFNLPKDKLEIIIHPESLVHAIIKLHNGLSKLIYHQTSMQIPLANAIFDENININDFYKEEKKIKKKKEIENLTFLNVNPKKFPMIKFKKNIFQFPSSPIIINAANEVLVNEFLKKNIPFSAIFKIILVILKDRNYKKYAIKKPINLQQINKIDYWSRKLTLEKVKLNYV